MAAAHIVDGRTAQLVRIQEKPLMKYSDYLAPMPVHWATASLLLAYVYTYHQTVYIFIYTNVHTYVYTRKQREFAPCEK